MVAWASTARSRTDVISGMAARPSMLECEIWKRRHLDLQSCFVLLTDAVDGDVESREEDQGQHGRDGEPADDGIGHRPPEHVVHDRDHAEDRGGCCQHDWPKLMSCRVNHSFPGLDTLRPLVL